MEKIYQIKPHKYLKKWFFLFQLKTDYNDHINRKPKKWETYFREMAKRTK